MRNSKRTGRLEIQLSAFPQSFVSNNKKRYKAFAPTEAITEVSRCNLCDKKHVYVSTYKSRYEVLMQVKSSCLSCFHHSINFTKGITTFNSFSDS